MSATKKRHRKKIILALAVSVVLLFIAVGSASAKECGIGIVDCEYGDTVVTDWTFAENMTCSTGYGLIIGAHGIKIDSAGYTLDGVAPGACDGMGVQRSGIYNKGNDTNMTQS